MIRVSCLLVAASFAGLCSAVDWPTLSFTPIVTNTFAAPTGVTHAGDSSQRVFVADRKGHVWILKDGKMLSSPFLDISARVTTTGAEQGLLGIAFPPGFATNQQFYVDYTTALQNAVVVSRFHVTADANVADAGSEQVVMTIPKPYNNHNGGQLAFGPDGFLYIGVGDGGSENDPRNFGQNTASFLGKILRIDVEGGGATYKVPATNPFISNPNYLPEIWSYGLRNPWRFSFDRATGDLFIGDVGQNRFEEVDFQAAGSVGGQNYGWRPMEGASMSAGSLIGDFSDFGSLTQPVAWYDHLDLPGDVVGSITGGYVYRGPHEPRMDGIYFYGDFMVGWIWGLKATDSGWEKLLLTTTNGIGGHFSISSFGEDDEGHILMADYYSGSIYQLGDSHEAPAPVFSPSNGAIPTNKVRVINPTENGTVHYTLDGSDPTETDSVLPPTGVIEIVDGTTVKARTFRTDLAPSAVTSGTFFFQTGLPVFTPPAGALPTNMAVAISTDTPGATIYFSTNGVNSAVYSGPFEVNASPSVVVTAFAKAPGFADSIHNSARYTNAVALRPAFSPLGPIITNGTSFSMNCFTPGATLYYTTDGWTPTTNSLKYEGAILINGGTTVKAFSVAPGYANSPVRSVSYSLVKTAPLVFDPPSGTVSYGTVVAISCPTPGSVIYFTTDGSTPTTNSATYSAPVTIQKDTLLKAFATVPEHADSDVVSQDYRLVQAAAPQFTPGLSLVTNGTTISISSATPGSVIYYTIDGSIPDTNSAVYSSPIVFTGPVTINAVSTAPQLDASDVSTAYFGLLNPQPSIVTTLAGTPAAGFVDGSASVARFSTPLGICIDSLGNLYVADSGNNAVRKILTSGQVTTIGSSGGFVAPTGVCVDKTGNVYVADGENCNRICKIATNDEVSVFANVTVCGPGIGNFAAGLWQMGMGLDENLYVGFWFGVKKITPDGNVTDYAGPGCNCGSGWAWNVAPALDANTNLYSATGGDLWITRTDGSTDLFSGGTNPVSDGPRLSAGFESLRAVTVDSSNTLYLADATRIRVLQGDVVSTIAGTGVVGYKNGPGEVAQFNVTAGVCVDANGNIYVSDSGNNCIRKISRDTARIGIADDWQLAHFGQVGIDPADDPDHDGMNNYAEFRAGTDPTDASSILAIDRSTVTNGDLQIRWQTVAGKSYSVQYSTDLRSWNTLGNDIQGDGEAVSVSDGAQSANGGERFYRVSVVGF